MDERDNAILKLLANQNQLHLFNWECNAKQAKIWHDSLICLESEWSGEKFLSQAETLLTKYARNWYLPLIDEKSQHGRSLKFTLRKNT